MPDGSRSPTFQDDQNATVVILRNVVDSGCAAKSLHHTEADSVGVEYRRKLAAHAARKQDVRKCSQLIAAAPRGPPGAAGPKVANILIRAGDW